MKGRRLFQKCFNDILCQRKCPSDLWASANNPNIYTNNFPFFINKGATTIAERHRDVCLEKSIHYDATKWDRSIETRYDAFADRSWIQSKSISDSDYPISLMDIGLRIDKDSYR